METNSSRNHPSQSADGSSGHRSPDLSKRLSDDQLQNDRIGADRTDQLHRILGASLCRRLGIQRIPDGFILSVIIPVFNEATTLERVVQRVRETGLPLEIVLVDDGSTDGTRDILARIANDDDCHVILHDHNQGKGAALKTGLSAATGDVIVIQDADMEYDPIDYHALLQPILEDRADVVYGSRFSSTVRRVPPLWHQAGNQLITLLTVLASGYRFTDVETCYKMFRRDSILEIIPTLREKRFGIEIELTLKLVKRSSIRIFERPIRYERRSYAEGKKIGWRDGVAAIWCIFRYSLFQARVGRRRGSSEPR